ncbi:BA14K family protein [Bradyrhizobium sp. LMTR 3]|uniref:BA14K family protein n=1 Tax=Bradyrhizobium sp. LMTR 3 TaxID=189873 RepID=UPI000810DAF8|nr:BA14K family protein [Bradyrhizobium sp. LMTR 3]OCK55011.1 hypothetical protein LMTR3_09555 [Bradyrhizobium sp. LMTR 3]
MSFERNLRIAAVVICASVPFAGSAVAAPMITAGTVHADAGNVVNVGWRGNRWHHGHHGWRHGYRRHYGWGPAVGGLAAGAIIGGAIANSRAQALENDAYCSQRFKSYDPRSGTYLGYDGLRHPCP